jgi:hypothetical protein
LGPAVKSIGTLSGFDLNVLTNDFVALGLGETSDVVSLGFHAQTRFALT